MGMSEHALALARLCLKIAQIGRATRSQTVPASLTEKLSGSYCLDESASTVLVARPKGHPRDTEAKAVSMTARQTLKGIATEEPGSGEP